MWIIVLGMVKPSSQALVLLPHRKVEDTLLYDRRGSSALAKPRARKEPAIAYLSKLSEGSSRTNMMFVLKRVARMLADEYPELGEPELTLSWHLLDFEKVAGLRSRLQEKYTSTNSVNLHIMAVRGVLKACGALGVMTFEEMHRALLGAEAVEGQEAPAGRAIEEKEIERLFAQCDVSTPIGARDAAMLVLLYGGGLRAAEVCKLNIDSFRGDQLLVKGKNRKQRELRFDRKAVAAWLAIRGDEEGPLLLATRSKIGEDGFAGRMSPKSVWRRVKELAEAAGIEDVSTHDFRRSFITHLLDADEDNVQVKKLAGHSSLDTTLIYDRREAKKRDAIMERFHKRLAPLLGAVKNGKSTKRA